MSTPHDILAMISIQTPGGLVFGTGRRLEGMTITFELDAKMEAGVIVDWRMELPGLDETAMGTMRVNGSRKDPHHTVTTFTGTVLTVNADDTDIFEVWRRGVEQGTRAFAISSRTPTDSWLAQATMVGSSDNERRNAVAAQEERRRRRLERAKLLVKNSKSWPDPADRDSGRVVASSGAFRQSLSGSAARPGGSGGQGASGETRRPAASGASAVATEQVGLETTTSRPRAQIANVLRSRLGSMPATYSAPEPEPEPEPPPPPPPPVVDPTVVSDRGMVLVTYGPESWRDHHRPALLKGRLDLPGTDLGAAGGRMTLFIRLPSGTTVVLDGEVALSEGGRTQVVVKLNPPTVRQIEIG